MGETMTDGPTNGTADTRTVVHLLRHGEVHNPTGVLYGRIPGFRLSNLGVQMAETVARHLAANDITYLVSSPLERAQQTMAPLAETLGLPVTLDERVIEADNRFEGRQVAPADIVAPANWPLLLNPFKPSWGEPYEVIATRMRSAIAAARSHARGHEAVIVSHQLPIWTVRRQLEGRRLWHDPRHRECTLASLTSLEYYGDELVSLSYSEPAAALLPRASKSVGA